MSAATLFQIGVRSPEQLREIFRRNLNTDGTRGRGNKACRRAWATTGQVFLTFTGWGNNGSIKTI